MKKFIIGIIIITVIMTISFIGCKTATDTTTSAETAASVEAEKATIAFMQHNYTDSFQYAINQGAREAAEALGYGYLQGVSDDDAAKELDLINNFSNQGATLLILGSNTQEAANADVDLAHKLGMKVVTEDNVFPESNAECQVGGDDIAAGYLAGKALAEAINGEGKVAINKFPMPVPPSENRVIGIKQAFLEYPGIEIIAEDSPGYDTVKAMDWTAAMIQSNPDIKGFISIEDTSALGIIRAIENAKLEDSIKSTCVVESAAIYDELKNGKVIQAVVAMHSYNYGAISSFMLDRLFNGRPVPSKILTTGVMVTKDNVDENLGYLEFIKK